MLRLQQQKRFLADGILGTSGAQNVEPMSRMSVDDLDGLFDSMPAASEDEDDGRASPLPRAANARWGGS
jgi:hypothetical protein